MKGVCSAGMDPQYVAAPIAAVLPPWEHMVSLGGCPTQGESDEHRSARSLGHHAAVTARRRPGHLAQLLLDRHRTSQSALHLCPSALGSEHLPVARLRTFLLGARNDDPLGSTTRSRAPCRSRCSRPVIAPTTPRWVRSAMAGASPMASGSGAACAEQGGEMSFR
jgi:hypothetical protein